MHDELPMTYASSHVQQDVKHSESFTIGRYDSINVLTNDQLEIEVGLHRVVWANRKTDTAFLLRFPNQLLPEEPRKGAEIPISTGNKRVKQRLHMPTMVSLSTLEELGNKYRVVKIRAPLPPRLNISMEKATDAEKKVRKRRETMISSFMTEGDVQNVLERGEMGRYVSRAVVAHNMAHPKKEDQITRYHVYQMVYRYWLHGGRHSGLNPDYGNCGAKGKYRNPGTAKRGRPPNRIATGHAPLQPGPNTSPAARDLIWMYWDLFGGKKDEYATAYNKLIKEQYTSAWVENERGEWLPGEERYADAPSLETFRYYVKSKYTPVDILKKLIPSIKWAQTKRALKGTAHAKLFGSAQTFMIDSTVADVYLVSRLNRNWIIGRPIVYFIRDVWSGMIVGLHVALEGPSWATARHALFNAFSRKGEYLRAHGFEMNDDDWPCWHGCINLVHDRGESLSIPSADSAMDLGFILSACPSFRPDLKGPIETLFHWMRRVSTMWMAGAVEARGRERGERDYRLDATLTLYEFTRIIIHSVLYFNRHADVSDRFDSTIREAGVENNPQALWKWGLENRNGSAPEWDKETLHATLLPSGDAYIKPDGVHFAGKKFGGRYADQMQLQEFARAVRNRKVKVKYSTVRPEEIYFLDESTGRYQTLSMLPGQNIPADTRLEEVLDLVMYQKLCKGDGEKGRKLAELGHRAFVDAEVSRAIAKKKELTPPVSKAAHLDGMREKRAAEAAMERALAESRTRGELSYQTEFDGQEDSESLDQTDAITDLLATIAQEAADVELT